MTIHEAKLKYGDEDDNYYVWCDSCPLDGNCPLEHSNCDGYGTAYKAIADYFNEQEGITIEHDVVSHPKHYCREGAMECIDEMMVLFGKEVVKHFCLCNAWKYRYRSNDKNGEEDIKKSDWYIRKYKELSENE